MKYWTLLALRTIVQIALIASVVLWSTTRTWIVCSTMLFNESSLQTYAYTNGYRLAWADGRRTGGWSGPHFEVLTVNREATATQMLIETFDADRPMAPVVAVRETEGATIVWLEHWVLCLTCFIATLVTWPRKKQSNDE